MKLTVVLLFWVLVGLSGCGGEKDEPVESKAAFVPIKPTPSSLTASLAQRRLNQSTGPFLLPSEVYQSLDAAKKRALVDRLVEPLFTKLDEQLGKRLVNESFELNLAVAQLERISRRALVDLVATKVATPQGLTLLDRFPTIPIALVKDLQSLVSRAPWAFRESVKAYPVPGTALDRVELRESGCAARAWVHEPIFTDDIGIYGGMEPAQADTVACYAENSEMLAEQFNQLTNGVDNGVSPFRTLLDNLGSQGFTVEVFTTRGYVDYLGYWFKRGDLFHAIRVAMFISSNGLNFPAEHGEVNFMIHKNGKRFAQLRWYFGMPAADHPGTNTYWRPHLFLPTSWAEVEHEVVHVYDSAKIRDAQPWLDTSARMMRGFQNVLAKHGAPFQHYGLFVCGDSLALYLSAIGETLGGSRLTNIFPLIRAQQVGSANLERWFAEASGLNQSRLNELYPADTSFPDWSSLRKRLLEAFPPRNDHRLKAFEDFRKNDLPRLRAGT